MKDGQAFPMHERDDALSGMLLRDYFAAKALQGMWANPAWMEEAAKITNGRTDGITIDNLNAKRAYLAADANARKRRRWRTVSIHIPDAPESVKYHGGYDPADPPLGDCDPPAECNKCMEAMEEPTESGNCARCDTDSTPQS